MISILYVDDEPGLLELCQIFLEQTGEFRVETVESAQEALAQLRREHYDAVISDYQMPGMNGISLLKSIRLQAGDIPFILFTGRGREEVVIEAVNNGADFYLQKGGDPKAQFAELMHKVRQAVTKKQAEKNLYESEKRLTDIINFLPDATFAIDREGKVIAWNRAIEELTGVPAAEMLGKGDKEYAIPFYGSRRPILIDLIFEPDERIKEQYSEIRREKDILIAETDLPRPMGKVLTLMGKASPLYDRQGRISGAIETIRDITASKQEDEELRSANEEITATEAELRKQYEKLIRNEQVLRDSEEQYRTLIETTGTGYVIIDAQGLVADANPEYVRMSGHRELAEIKGRSVVAWTAPYDQERNADAVRECFRIGFVRNFDIDYVDAAGKITPVEVNATVVNLKGSVQIVTLCRDLSSRRNAAEALRASESTARALLNAPTDTIILLDTGGVILDLNETAVQKMGRKREDLVGVLCDTILPPDLAQERRMKISEVITTGKAIRFIDHHGGTWFDNVVYPIPDNQGNVGRLAIIARDITDQKKAESELQETAAAISSIFRAAPVGIGVVSDRILIKVNDRLCEMTGYSPEELVGKSARVLYPADEEYDNVGREKYRQIREKGTGTVETRWKRKDGSERDILLSSTPVDFSNPTKNVTFTALDITDRKQAEEKLRAAYEKLSANKEELRAQYEGLAAAEAEIRGKEQQLREITSNIPGVVYQVLVSGDGAITGLYASERSREIFSLDNSLPDVFERFTQCVHPDDLKDFSDSIHQAFRNKTKWNFEGRFIKPTGELIWFQAISGPMETDTGVVFSGVLLDVTSRRNAEQALRQSEALYGTLADAAQDLIYIINRDDTVAYVNAFAAKMTGRNRQEIIGRPRADLFYGPEGERQYRSLQKVFSSGTPLRVESRVTMPSGITWQDTHLIPLKDPEGNVTAILGISRDITSLKQAEEALRSSESQYRSIIDNVQDMLYRTDMEGKITMISPAGARQAGFNSPDEMIGLDLAQTLYADPQERKKFLAILARHGSVNAYPLVLKDRLGHQYHVTASSHYFTDDEGHRLGVEGIVHDITHLKKIEDALKEANRKLNLLNSITRHDVANQLTVLQGYTQLAMVKNPDPIIADFLKKIDTVTTFIGKQIDFSKTYQELGVHDPGWHSLDDIFARTKPKDILFSSSCTGAEIFADPMLEKVFANLFGNAVMHGERVSRITVRCEPEGDHLLITVEDNGVGIPLDLKQKIFKKGFGKNTG
ncbi:MAG: PAS domain S-box protein, partial [Methanoregula sp.]|nr:PAS domain S-box protein [Methanoregula sp.]